MKKLMALWALVMMMAIVVAPVSAEQVTKEGTITIVGGSSNTVTSVECYARGVGKAQANEIIKLALFNPSATTTSKVDFAVLEANGTYTSIASQDYTAGANAYVNYAPVYKFITGSSGALTNWGFTPYSTKTLRIDLYQNKTNAVGTTTTYTYQVYTK